MTVYKFGIKYKLDDSDANNIFDVITTKQHFKWFEQSVHKYINYFGLVNYEYSVVHKEVVQGSRAGVLIWDTAQGAMFGLAETYTDCDPPTKDKMDFFAFHEVIELLLFQIGRVAMNRTFDADELERETHNVIRTFENKVRPFIKDKR